MKIFKKIISSVICVAVLAVTVPFSQLAPYVSAESANLKDSLENYVGLGGLSYTSSRLLSFDDASLLNKSGMSASPSIDTSDKKQGSGCVSVSCTADNDTFYCLYTNNGAFNFTVRDKKAANVKMWVYVNDADLVECDHDRVYDTPQKNCYTLWITFGYSSSTAYQYTVQHTVYGSGWQEIEVDFATDNVLYKNHCNINWNLRYMKIFCRAKTGAVIKFDDLRLINYSTSYSVPECENNGRWLSTCDYNSIDGTVVTEWFGSYFDLLDKKQGSSCVAINGHKEHVDFRQCWAGLSTKCYWA
ncbi:MAG: hypothetical protein ACI4QV_03425, partial [Acutalibacteraceae bacterium]